MKAKILIAMLAAVMMAACSKYEISGRNENGNVRLRFGVSTSDLDSGLKTRAQDEATRGEVAIGDYFTKLNVMVFNSAGEKVFDKVRTQLRGEDGFGQMNLSLTEGVYTIVAVGHSSVKSATIKSPEMVQFTASDGEKLTDTFCYCGEVTVGEQAEQHDLVMNRVTAMVRVVLTDEDIPASMARMKFDYTGGSANFNPTTFEGTTKSTQTENRVVSGDDKYAIFTFPYMAKSGTLKLTMSALDSEGDVLKQRVLEQVPVTRNRITTYTGRFFDEGGTWDVTQSGFGFTINTEWDGEDFYTF